MSKVNDNIKLYFAILFTFMVFTLTPSCADWISPPSQATPSQHTTTCPCDTGGRP